MINDIVYCQCPACNTWIRAEKAYKGILQGIDVLQCTVCGHEFADFECKYKITNLKGKRRVAS